MIKMKYFSQSSFIYLDLSNFNTSKCEQMDMMFSECTQLTSIELSNFDTKNVKYMSSMFKNC